jgi:hypothetical protein
VWLLWSLFALIGFNLVKVLLSKNIIRSLDGLMSNFLFDETRRPFSIDFLLEIVGDSWQDDDIKDIFLTFGFDLNASKDLKFLNY